MEVTIQGRNVDVDNVTRDYVNRKFDRIVRHGHLLRQAAVVINRQETQRLDQRFAAEITINVDGAILRSHERAATPMAAFDQALDVLDQRVRRFKERNTRSERPMQAGKATSIRYQAPLGGVTTANGAEASMVRQGNLVRVKRFPIKPMTVDDAIFEMEMLGHSFFLFLNSEDQQYNLLYQRTDGDYGLIVPEML